MSGATSLPGAELFFGKSYCFEQATFRRALLPGAELFSDIRLFFLNKPLVWGSCAARGRTFAQKYAFFWKKPLVRGSCAAWGRTVPQECVLFWKQPLAWGSCAASGRFFSRNLALLKHITSTISTECTFRISGTPVRRTRRQKSQKLHPQKSGTPVRRTERRKSQKMHLQEFRDSCAQNKTSEISNSGLPRFVGLLCAEQNVGNRKT